MNPVYRNLKARDTLLGLSLTDLIIMGMALNVLLQFHPGEGTTGRLLNFVFMGVLYLGLFLLKKIIRKGFWEDFTGFLFKPRHLCPTRDRQLNPLPMVRRNKSP